MLPGWAQRRASLPKRSASVNTACSKLCLITRNKRNTRDPICHKRYFKHYCRSTNTEGWLWDGNDTVNSPVSQNLAASLTVEGARILSSINMLTFLCISHRLLQDHPLSLPPWNIKYMTQEGVSHATYTDCIQVPLFKLQSCCLKPFQGKCECGVQLRGSCIRGTTGLQKLWDFLFLFS